jgi:hypothetical protein
MTKRGTNGRRAAARWMAVLVAATAWGFRVPPADAVLVAGVCVLNLTLSGEPVGILPEQPTWTVNGHGPCLVPGHDDLLTGTLTGSLTGVAATSAGCAAGVYTGDLTFQVSPALEQVDSTVAAAVMVGPVLEITMAALPTFAGAGVFAQLSTGATVDCPTTGNTSTMWKGVFAFEDPPPP